MICLLGFDCAFDVLLSHLVAGDGVFHPLAGIGAYPDGVDLLNLAVVRFHKHRAVLAGNHAVAVVDASLEQVNPGWKSF